MVLARATAGAVFSFAANQRATMGTEPASSVDPGILRGLTAAQARRALQEVGPNELKYREDRGWLRSLGVIAAQPMIALLLGAGGLYWTLGSTVDALLLLACVLFT